MQDPFVLGLFLVHCAQTDLVRAQFEARTHFREGDGLVILAGVCVVTERDKVSTHEEIMSDLPLVGECHNALAVHTRYRE